MCAAYHSCSKVYVFDSMEIIGWEHATFKFNSATIWRLGLKVYYRERFVNRLLLLKKNNISEDLEAVNSEFIQFLANLKPLANTHSHPYSISPYSILLRVDPHCHGFVVG